MRSSVDVLATVTRRIRFPGRYRLLRWLVPPERFRARSFPARWLRSYDGDLCILCDLGSFIEWNIYFRGYYDPDLSLVLKRLASPGIVAMDIGANIGAYTLLLAKKAGNGGMVLSYEPNPEVYRLLQSNIGANGLQNQVNLNTVALSRSPGTATMHGPRADYVHRGVASLHRYAGVLTEDFEVKIDTIDAEVSRRGLSRLDLIKIDTEGNDVNVLWGGRGAITRLHPRIVFEANRAAHQAAELDLESIHAWLRSEGYRFYTIAPLGRLRALGHNARLPDRNVVCMPPEG